MVNEEDHLRLQVLVGGFRLRDAWQAIDRLDDELADAGSPTPSTRSSAT